MKLSRDSLLNAPPLAAAFMLFFPAVVRPDALDNWSTNQVSTNSFRLTQVVYGNGRFVAAGGQSDDGVILSSEDGAAWTLRASGITTPSLVWGSAYGGGRFVTVGHFGGIASSTNGINWRFTNVNNIGLNAVTYGLGRFVAVGGNSSVSNIYTSTNGINWTERRSHPTEARNISDIAFGSVPGPVLRFVATGPGDGFIYVSADGGTSWTRDSIPTGGAQISRVNGRFMIPLGDGTNLISTDAVTWNAISTGLTGALGRVIYAGGRYFSRERHGSSVATSIDGTNWIALADRIMPKPIFGALDSGFAFDGRRMVAVGFTLAPGNFRFNSFICRSDEFVALKIIQGVPTQIELSGLVGSTYRVAYSNNLSALPGTWPTLTNVLLTNSPFRFGDPLPPSGTYRFYRSALLP